MGTNRKGGRDIEISDFQKRIVGVQKHLTASVTLGGKVLTPDALEKAFQDSIDADAALVAARKVVSDTLKVQRANEKAAKGIDKLLRGFLQSAWGTTNSNLSDFGYPVAAPKKQSVTAKAAAVAKGKATRAAKKGK